MHTGTKVFLGARDVCRMLGISRQTLAVSVRRGTMPQQIRLGKRALRWASEDLDNWAKGAYITEDDEHTLGLE